MVGEIEADQVRWMSMEETYLRVVRKVSSYYKYTFSQSQWLKFYVTLFFSRLWEEHGGL